MTPYDYQQLAARTECDQVNARRRMVGIPSLGEGLGSMTPIRLNHGVIGLSGEVGELASVVEKHVYYGQALDLENLAEEVGDCCWYIALICNAAKFDLGEIMLANIQKLVARYPDKYTDELALEANRNRAGERAVVQDGHFGHVATPKASPFEGRVCEVCGEPATRACHDSNRAFTREETHWFCTRHDRPTGILKD